MSIGVRELTVLSEFKPFGLVSEELDGKSLEDVPEEHHYFLFHPDVAREGDGPAGPSTADLDFSSPSPPYDDGDHEIFIRGNRIIWSTGCRVHKRYSSPKTIIMACWCRMEAISDALLCVLQIDTLSIYGASGEVACVPLPFAIASISPLPFGLLLQKAVDGSSRISSSALNARDLSRATKDTGWNEAIMSSHLILKHPLEEPQATYIEERGKFISMKDFDERTIWTSDVVPLMASYNKSKMQHSVWLVEIVSRSEAETTMVDAVSTELSIPQYSFRRIWQGKCSQSAANKVFLATDMDGVPIVCFLFVDQKVLLAVRLQIDESYDEGLIDIKPQMSWTIPALSAASVTVTRPRVKVGRLPFSDIIVLGAENHLLLYSGKQCLCRFLLPIRLGKEHLHSKHSSGSADMFYDLKITGIKDAVEGRINVIANNGQLCYLQIFRCSLHRTPSSSLANDCITAVAQGLQFSFYNHFASLLWGDFGSAYFSISHPHKDSEWEAFAGTIIRICSRYRTRTLEAPSPVPDTAWDFLVSSKFHKCYLKHSFRCGTSLANMPDFSGVKCNDPHIQDNQNQKIFYSQLLAETLDSLHALYESLKLDKLRKQDVGQLVVLLNTIAISLGEANYMDYYARDFPSLLDESCSFDSCATPRTPPSLFQWIENCLQKGCHASNMKNLPLLLCRDKICVLSWARKIVSFYSLLLGAERKGRKLSTGVYCEIANGSARMPEELTVLAMVGERFGRQQLDLLPLGVSLPLRHALDKCRESPPTDWPAAAYVLVGREDLAMACLGSLSKEHESQSTSNLVAISVPYMLQLQPVCIPSSLTEITGSDSMKLEDSDSSYRSLEDGMEHIFNSSTQMRFGRDLRLNEVRRLLCSAKPVAVETSVSPTASDQDLQQHQLWNLAQRTTALPFGRGAFTLATTYALLTEALRVPKLILAGRLPAQQNATVNLDPNLRNISELRSWPEFHNGVAAGLRLAPFEGKMSRTWIQYNKPEEPNFTHAGILLSLGLHGHLCSLAITDIYRYLTQEHDITTVGILLGMAASYRGTMQPEVSRMLYLHVPSRHQLSFPELELPTNLQSAALVSIGLLYEGSAHPFTMKMLLSEIGRRSGGDNVLEREGYAVAAGYALGLVALGRGKDAFGFVDSFMDRLFQYIGEKGFQNEKSLLAAQTTEDHTRFLGQMVDGAHINVDVTAPGATIALALIFMKTESEEMMCRLRLPVTHYDLQYVRPDFLMLRVIARNLIMWSKMQPSRIWMESQIPDFIKSAVLRLHGGSDDDEFDAEAVVQAYVNIIAGACISLGLKYAGTKSEEAQELLHSYALYFLNEIKHIPAVTANALPKGLLQYVDRGTSEICLHLIVLSLSLVMAGSGHLRTFRLLRYLRGRSSTEGHINYGIQMAVSLAIGFLFLGGGMQTLSTGNSAIAALLITLYPRLPTGPNDNRCLLQAFRHLYVIAAESRRVQTVDVDTGLPVYCPLEVTIKETEHYAETSFCEVTPCILPERSVLKTVRICGPRYWPQVIQLIPEDKPWWRFGDKTDPFNGGILYIKRKVGSCSYVDDPVGCQSLLSRAMHKVCDTIDMNCPNTKNNNYPTPGSYKIDQLVGTFSADPSLIAFAQLCCDSSKSRSDANFQEFCSQLLFECVSKDRPAVLQIYLSLYTTIESMWEQVKHSNLIFEDSLFLSSLKLALAYNEALATGKLSSPCGSIIQCSFIQSVRKHIEEILISFPSLCENFFNYLDSGKWPDCRSDSGKMDAILLSWYLIWYGIPSSHVVRSAVEKIKVKAPTSSTMVPLLQLLLPTTQAKGILEIDKFHFSSSV
ncbi:anaphase-promoting complex subunit 1 isoform X1 [Canna indica]|uniref:Anaphase-promoting complex subunit 1 n=1 Tax=Canna indica TaxID=4628 RepID=A0AAQ3QBS5_9LILI|nr:anaphase-promoting complex subunit 1 isoform X1 [Canna indica]